MAPAESASPNSSDLPPLPEDGLIMLIILPVRNTVLFPGVVLPLTVGRKRWVTEAQEAARTDKPIGVQEHLETWLARQREADTEGGFRFRRMWNVICAITCGIASRSRLPRIDCCWPQDDSINPKIGKKIFACQHFFDHAV